jgi:hypothetical protein
MLGFVPLIIWSIAFVVLTGLVCYGSLEKARKELLQAEQIFANNPDEGVGKQIANRKKVYNRLVAERPTRYFAKLLGYPKV